MLYIGSFERNLGKGNLFSALPRNNAVRDVLRNPAGNGWAFTVTFFMNTQIFSDIPMFDGTVHFLHHPAGWFSEARFTELLGYFYPVGMGNKERKLPVSGHHIDKIQNINPGDFKVICLKP